MSSSNQPYIHEAILKATKCPPDRTGDIEAIMRVGTPILGELSRSMFAGVARGSWKAVQYLDTQKR